MSIAFTFGGLVFKVFENVYEPAEDSFLLARHAAGLRGEILEVGCGCGIVSVVNARNNPENRVVACDINEDAIKNTKLNAEANGIKNVMFLRSDLFSEIEGRFDYVLFNPPYLPTARGDRLRGKLNLAFDGGSGGRKVLDRFLSGFSRHLRPEGSALLVHSSLNGLKKTKWKLAETGYRLEILGEERFFFEKLYVLKITRAQFISRDDMNNPVGPKAR